MQKETIQLNTCLPLIARWYACARRDLPWRRTREPYHIWLSEIMLQQTRIEAVIPYYHRFLSRFPDIRALAQAEDAQLVKLWEGLGYYSRARYLKKAAVLIMERYGGELPRQAAELKKLPGIGDYTAGAISSIAFGEPEPAVDGNVLRVITRVLACGEDIRLAGTRSRITELLRRCYPAGEDAALLTEGIMELGETVCIPNGEARCRECPLQAHCLAHKNGIEAQFPVKSPMKKRRVEEKLCCCSTGRESTGSAGARIRVFWQGCGSSPMRRAASVKQRRRHMAKRLACLYMPARPVRRKNTFLPMWNGK